MFPSPARPHQALALTALCLGTFMLTISVMIVIVALPSIHAAAHQLFRRAVDYRRLLAVARRAAAAHGVAGRHSWPPTGVRRRAGPVHPRLAALRHRGSGPEIVAFRAVQGIGGATVVATSLALPAQTFTGRRFGAALGIWRAVITLSLGCAPVLGGLLSEVSWRLIFIINIPAGLAAIVLTLIGVQEFRPPGTRRIDLPGSGVFTLGLVALIYGLAESGSDGWSSDRMIAE